jgi:hypothetical protein
MPGWKSQVAGWKKIKKNLPKISKKSIFVKVGYYFDEIP